MKKIDRKKFIKEYGYRCKKIYNYYKIEFFHKDVKRIFHSILIYLFNKWKLSNILVEDVELINFLITQTFLNILVEQLIFLSLKHF